jgi:hypothetical protein
MEAISFYDMNPTNPTIGRSEIGRPIRSKFPPRQKKTKKLHGYRIEATPKLNVCEPLSEALPMKFNRLLAEWQKESIVMSSITDMVMLPSYQAIIGMGPAVVSLILNELKQDPDYFFWALEAITGDNPILPEDEGNLDRMTNAWIRWGQENGII